MDGFEVKKIMSVIENMDIIVTATGNKDIIGKDSFLKMSSASPSLSLLIFGKIGFENKGCLLYTSPSPRD